MTKKLMTAAELADHLNVSLKTAKALPIPYTKIGNQRRYHPDMVKRYEVLNASGPLAALAWKEAS